MDILRYMGGFPKLGVPSLRGPDKKDYSMLGSHSGPTILGNYHRALYWVQGLKFRG